MRHLAEACSSMGRRGAGCCAEGSRLLDQLAEAGTSGDLQAVYASCSAFLQPVVASTDESGQKSVQTVTALSRKYAPFLVEYLKASFARLSEPGLASALVRHVVLGISGLDALRGSLKGRPDELEIQRHSLVCRLGALQLYDVAAEQGWQLLRIICCKWGVQPRSHRLSSRQDAELPLPHEDEPRERIAVVVGLAANLLHSVVCSKDAPAEQLTALPTLTQGLAPWLRHGSSSILRVLPAHDEACTEPWTYSGCAGCCLPRSRASTRRPSSGACTRCRSACLPCFQGCFNAPAFPGPSAD